MPEGDRKASILSLLGCRARLAGLGVSHRLKPRGWMGKGFRALTPPLPGQGAPGSKGSVGLSCPRGLSLAPSGPHSHCPNADLPACCPATLQCATPASGSLTRHLSWLGPLHRHLTNTSSGNITCPIGTCWTCVQSRPCPWDSLSLRLQKAQPCPAVSAQLRGHGTASDRASWVTRAQGSQRGLNLARPGLLSTLLWLTLS